MTSEAIPVMMDLLRSPKRCEADRSLVLDHMGPLIKQRRLAVVPCAGKGTRMGPLPMPKPLFPIAGEPSVVRLLKALSEHFDEFYLPINDDPTDAATMRGALELAGFAGRFTLVPTTAGRGDGDAVLCALEAFPSDYDGDVLVVWGDTTICDASIVPACLRLLHIVGDECPLIIPTSFEEEPYVALLRDSEGRVCDVKYRRRGELEKNKEHDLSLFFFRRQPIHARLRRMAARLMKPDGRSYESFQGELCFLDLVRDLYRDGIEAAAPCIGSPGSVLSFNTQEEAAALSVLLGNDASADGK